MKLLAVTLLLPLSLVVGGVGATIVEKESPALAYLATLASGDGVAVAVNNAGQIVGQSGSHAVLWENGQIKDLGIEYSYASDINSAGDIVGTADFYSLESASQTRALLWRGDTVIDLGTLGGNYSHASGINDSGQVVGESTTASGDMHAFLWRDGVMTGLGPSFGRFSSATAINNMGQIVGLYTPQPYVNGAFIWKRGAWMDLPTAGAPGSFSTPYAINDRGQVVGYSVQPLTPYDWEARAVLYDRDTLTDLGAPQGAVSVATDISNTGVVVGWAAWSAILARAFVWQHGEIRDLAPTASYSVALGVNDRGWVVGYVGVQGRPVLWLP